MSINLIVSQRVQKADDKVESIKFPEDIDCCNPTEDNKDKMFNIEGRQVTDIPFYENLNDGTKVHVTKHPHFIIFDLDGTLISESRPITVLPLVRESLLSLKSNGHFLSVCSNNIMAKSILNSVGLLDVFDVVVGYPSTSFKALEIMEICKYYRYLLRTHLIRTKLRTNRIIFVDNDEENTSNIVNLNAGLRVCSSVSSCINVLTTDDHYSPVNKAKQFTKLNRELCLQYNTKGSPTPEMMQVCKLGPNVTVYISTKARSNTRYGTENMKFHIRNTCKALLRCGTFIVLDLKEVTKFKHKLCKICNYNMNHVETAVYCS